MIGPVRVEVIVATGETTVLPPIDKVVYSVTTIVEAGSLEVAGKSPPGIVDAGSVTVMYSFTVVVVSISALNVDSNGSELLSYLLNGTAFANDQRAIA